ELGRPRGGGARAQPRRRLRRPAARGGVRRHGRSGHQHRARRRRRGWRCGPAGHRPGGDGEPGGRRDLHGAGRVHLGEDAERAARPRGREGAPRARAQPRRGARRAHRDAAGARRRRRAGARGRRPAVPRSGDRSAPARRRRTRPQPRGQALSDDGGGLLVRHLRRRRAAAAAALPARLLVALGGAAVRRHRARRRRGAVLPVHTPAVVVRRAPSADLRSGRGGHHVRDRLADRRNRRL
ncbi:MAG: Nodulin-related protein SCO_2027, partial [uncultured Blastococcus sp.]